MRVAIIPARGGSKRIPGKNSRDFCGKPMIAWSIDAALSSGCFDRVIVSTDDDTIADIARQHGAEIPFIRPAVLSGDHVATIPVIKHAVEHLSATGLDIDYACCIYATAPFIDASFLQQGLALIQSSDCDYAFSVGAFQYPVQRALRVQTDGRVAMLDPQAYAARSQDLEPIYHDAGQFYWGTTSAWLAEKPVFNSHALPILLPPQLVQDIDTPQDWIYAEWLFRANIAQQSADRGKHAA